MPVRSDTAPDLSVIRKLKEAARQALQNGHSLESAVIVFETIEMLLRLSIRSIGSQTGVDEASLRRAADRETSFRQLVLYFDLLDPGNGQSDRLLALNRQRNAVMHRLFDQFESIQAYHEEIEALCLSGIDTVDDLVHLLEEPSKGRGFGA